MKFAIFYCVRLLYILRKVSTMMERMKAKEKEREMINEFLDFLQSASPC